MPTINEVIARATQLRPDTFPDSIKCRWLCELDGKIMRETMHGDTFLGYTFPKDGDRELLIGEPYDNIYELYIIAMSDFFSGEMVSYAASAALFEEAYREFRKNYIRKNLPPQSEYKI